MMMDYFDTVSYGTNYQDDTMFTTLTPMKQTNALFSEPESISPVMYAGNNSMSYTSSGCSNTTPENYAPSEPCLICGGIAKGLHFQVNSCRACAAFYRRSVKSKLVYRCQRGIGNCDLTQKTKGKPLCRYCRMKKCTSVGMRIESESSNGSLLLSPDSGDNNLFEFLEPVTELTALEMWNKQGKVSEPHVDNGHLIYNPQPLISTIKQLLLQSRIQNFGLPSDAVPTTLQRLTAAVTRFVNDGMSKTGEVFVITEISLGFGIEYQENFLLRLTEVVMSCQYFNKVPECDRFLLFKKFYHVYQQIDRAFQTMQCFGCELNDSRYLLTRNNAIDVDTGFKYTHMNEKQRDSTLNIMQPLKVILFKHMLNPMKMLKPSLLEIAYLATQILWSTHEISNLCPETYDIANEALGRVANEMHNYYTYDKQIPCYAARLTSLQKLVSVAEHIVRTKKDVMTTARVFGMMENDFFESELFQ